MQTGEELLEENDRLQRRLAKCKADKEFVWQLWKQLQVDTPDVTKVVDLIVTREKEKFKQREIQIQSILQSKTNEITELTKALYEKSSLAHEADGRYREAESVMEEGREEVRRVTEELGRQRAEKESLEERLGAAQQRGQEFCEEVKSLKTALTAVQEEREEMEGKYRQTSSQLKKLQPLMREMEEQMSTLNRECSQNSVKCKNLDADLVAKSEQLKKANDTLKKRNRELRKLRDTVHGLQEQSTVHGLQEQSTVCELQEQSTMTGLPTSEDTDRTKLEAVLVELTESPKVKDERIEHLEMSLSEKERQLMEVSEHYKQQIEGFEEQLKVLQQKAVRSISPNPSSGMRVGYREEEGLRTCLERTEAELFEVKNTLKIKDKELSELKVIHNRRLERMKTLQEEHKIVLQQIRLYEGDMSSPGTRVLSPHHSSSLQHEDSSAVWNDLNYYKKHCAHLNQKLMQLSEECDVLRASSLNDRAALHQLQKQNEEKHEDLFQKLSVIADLELESVSGPGSQQKNKPATPPAPPTSHYSKMVLRLQKEKADLQRQCKESRKECEDVRGQLEAVRRDLQHERRRTALRTRRSTVDRSTNTASTNTTSTNPTSTASTSTTSTASTNTIGTSSQRATLSGTSDREAQTELVLGLIGGSEQDGRPQTTHTSTQTIGETESPIHTPHSRTSNGGRSTASPPAEEDSQVVEGGVSSGKRGKVDRGRRPKTSQCVCSQHQCVEDSLKLVRAVTEVKALKAKCKDLERQVSSLVMDKQNLTHSLSVEKRRHSEQAKEIDVLTEQLSSTRLLNERLSHDVVKWREAYNDTKAKFDLLESAKSREVLDSTEKMDRLTAEKRRMEERLKSCLQRSREEKHSLQTLEGSLVKKTEEFRELEHKVSRLEHDLKQKRSLVENMKKKDSSRSAFLDECQGKIDTLSAEVQGLSSSNDQYRARAQGLRSQLTKESQEKRKLSSQLSDLQSQLSSASQDLSKCRSLLKQEQRSSQLLKEKLQLTEEHAESANQAVLSTQDHCQHLRREVAEHRRFTKNLLHELCSCVRQRRDYVKMSEEKRLTSRARELAKAALNLSDREVAEFLSEPVTSSEDYQAIADGLERLWTTHTHQESMSLSSEMMFYFSPLTKALQT